MTDEKLEDLWKVLSSATNVSNIPYDEAVVIGSVFGEMKATIQRLRKENWEYKSSMRAIVREASKQ